MQNDQDNTSALIVDTYRQFYQMLDASGLQYYWPRVQPAIRANPVQLCSEAPCFGAALLVLIDKPLQQVSNTEQKTLTGMLTVLKISPPNMICFAWFNEHHFSSDHIRALIEWIPKNLLFLGTIFKSFATECKNSLKIPTLQSYSPAELAQGPHLKRSTYNDLVAFSKIINSQK